MSWLHDTGCQIAGNRSTDPCRGLLSFKTSVGQSILAYSISPGDSSTEAMVIATGYSLLSNTTPLSSEPVLREI